MKVIKHRSTIMEFPIVDIIGMARGEVPIPSGYCVNVTGDGDIIFEPEDCCNLLGIIDENYLVAFDTEEKIYRKK